MHPSRAPVTALLVALACAAFTVPGKAQVFAPGNPRVVAVLQEIRATLRSTRYDHSTRIDLRAGRYDFDCSTMAAFVLGYTGYLISRAYSKHGGVDFKMVAGTCL